jgi:hypothetical protein
MASRHATELLAGPGMIRKMRPCVKGATSIAPSTYTENKISNRISTGAKHEEA